MLALVEFSADDDGALSIVVPFVLLLPASAAGTMAMLLLLVAVAVSAVGIVELELEEEAGLAPAVPGVRFPTLTAEMVGRGPVGMGLGRTAALDLPEDDLPDFDPFLLFEDRPFLLFDDRLSPPPPMSPLDDLEHPLPFLLLPILLEPEQSESAPNDPVGDTGFMANDGGLVGGGTGLTGLRVVGGTTGLRVVGRLVVGWGDSPVSGTLVGALLVGLDVVLLDAAGAVLSDVGARLPAEAPDGDWVNGLCEGSELGWSLGSTVGSFVGFFVGRRVIFFMTVGTACAEYDLVWVL